MPPGVSTARTGCASGRFSRLGLLSAVGEAAVCRGAALAPSRDLHKRLCTNLPECVQHYTLCLLCSSALSRLGLAEALGSLHIDGTYVVAFLLADQAACAFMYLRSSEARLSSLHVTPPAPPPHRMASHVPSPHVTCTFTAPHALQAFGARRLAWHILYGTFNTKTYLVVV